MKKSVGLIALLVMSMMFASCHNSSGKNKNSSSSNQESQTSESGSSQGGGGGSNSSELESSEQPQPHEHTPGSPVRENEIAPTCGQDGSYDMVTYCTVCHQELSRQQFTIDATGNHNFVRNEDTLEYVCSVCGEFNGRDYEMSIELPVLHVDDIYNNRNYTHTFKNDDHALAFGFVNYRIGSMTINNNLGSNFAFPSSLEGQNVTAYVYVGVINESYIYYDDGGDGLSNLQVFSNGVALTKNGTMIDNAIGQELGVVDSKFYVYSYSLGTLLPSPYPAWPADEIRNAFTYLGLEPLALPPLRHESIVSYQVVSDSERFLIYFNGLKDAESMVFTRDFYKDFLMNECGFTQSNNHTFVSPDLTYQILTGLKHAETGEYSMMIERLTPPTYTVTWKNYDGTVLETDTEVERGAMPEYNGLTPTKPSSGSLSNYFSGWDQELAPVTSDIVYTATFYESPFVLTLEAEGWMCHGMIDKTTAGEVSIPGKPLDNLPIVALSDEAFKDHSNITSLVIPACVTSIGVNALTNMFALASLTVPFVGAAPEATGENGLFGYFFNKNAAEGLTETIQYYTSNNYSTSYIPTGLKTVTVLGGKLSYGAFGFCKNLDIVNIAGVEVIGERAFDFCEGLRTINFTGDNLKRINDFAFSATGLQTLTIPNSVTKIGNFICNQCSSLTTFLANNEENKLQEIGWLLFQGCTSIETIAIPLYGHLGTLFDSEMYEGGVEVITETQTYYLPATLKNFKDTGGILSVKAFEKVSLNSLELTEQVELIQPGSLAAMASLTNLTIPYVGCIKDAEEVGKLTPFGAIFGEASYPDSYSAQPNLNISGTTPHYYLPKSLKNVIVTGDQPVLRAAFDNCKMLESVTFEKGLEVVPDYCFDHCEAIKTVDIGENTRIIDEYAFRNCESLLEAPLHEGLQAIMRHAFVHCESLTSVTIPSTVQTLGRSGAQGHQFDYCAELTTVTFLNDITDVYMFAHCPKLTTVNHGGNIVEYKQNLFEEAGFTTFTVPEGIKIVGAYCFQQCTSLTTINLPVSLTKIGGSCFNGDTSLSTINYAGTKEQWGKVTKNSGWSKNIPAMYVICSDGQVAL